MKQSVSNIGKENLELKQKIKELEVALLPWPLFLEPLKTIQPTLSLEDILKISSKWKGSSSLLQAIRKYVGDDINKIIDLIQGIWELTQSSTNFAPRITNFKDYLHKDPENDEGFYKDIVGT